MSRKDFVKLAEFLHYHGTNPAIQNNPDAKYGFDMAVDAICDACKTLNPNFDKTRFIEAIQKRPR